MWCALRNSGVSVRIGAFHCIRSFSEVARENINHIYCPETTERKWISYWQKNVDLHPNNESDDEFTMILPPPNVTGKLHLGHAMTVAIEDALMRYNRMLGRNVNWIPGMDHAGIATQALFDREIRKNGDSKEEIGREMYESMLFEWSRNNQERIREQLKSMGCLLDWDHEYYTMDKHCHDGVIRSFIELCEKGYIYRGKKMLYMCPSLESVISDIEVNWLTVDHPQHYQTPAGVDVELGYIYDIKYPIVGKEDDPSEYVRVSTTRPETIFGDSCLAIHSHDERHMRYLTSQVHNPLTSTPLRLYVDDILVHLGGEGGEKDPGGELPNAVKITPFHDFADYAFAQRHGVRGTRILNRRGEMEGNCGVYRGLDRFCARTKVVEELERKGLLLDKRKHAMVVPLCSRTGDILEPYLQSQWFMRTEALSKQIATSYPSTFFTPTHHYATFRRYLEHSQDWCLSRQLWWGHRVPAFRILLQPGVRVEEKEALHASTAKRIIHGEAEDTNEVEEWVVARDEEDAKRYLSSTFAIPTCSYQLEQDSDVFDTWFSSSLLPLLLHPTSPLSLLETGQDILFFWVTRMLWLSEALRKQRPFEHVLLHSMVVDGQGKKMSKSRGNGIDPMDILHGRTLEDLLASVQHSDLGKSEKKAASANLKTLFPSGIRAYGNDVLRGTLFQEYEKVSGVKITAVKLEYNRYICGKLWNLYRFYRNYRADVEQVPIMVIAKADNVTKYMLMKSECVKEEIMGWMDRQDVGKAYTAAVAFLLNDMCDFYVEYLKSVFQKSPSLEAKQNALGHVRSLLASVLRQLHPFLPFITEEINAQEFQEAPSLLLQPYFGREKRPVEPESDFMRKMEDCIGLGREINRFYSICRDLANTSVEKRSCVLLCSGTAVPEELCEIVSRVARMTVTTATETPTDSHILFPSPLSGMSILFPLAASSKTGVLRRVQESIDQLEKQKTRLIAKRDKIEADLGSAAFLSHAPQTIVQREQEEREAIREKLVLLGKSREGFERIMKQNQ